MKQRLKGLVCLWMAIILALGIPMSALAEDISAYLVKNVSQSSFDSYGNAEGYSLTLDTPLDENTDVIAATNDAMEDGYFLSGWKLWRGSVSGGVVNGIDSSFGPIKLAIDDSISGDVYNVVTDEGENVLALEPVFLSKYKLDPQPTGENPTVGVMETGDAGDSWDDITEDSKVSYQWYESSDVSNAVIEGTAEENQINISSNYSGNYDAGTETWSHDSVIDIEFSVKADDVIQVTPVAPDENVSTSAVIYEFSDNENPYIDENGVYSRIISESKSSYNLYICDYEPGVTFKINIIREDLADPVEGQTDNTLTAIQDGRYVCKVTIEDKIVLLSNPVDFVQTVEYTVSFNSNGGSEVADISVKEGENPVKPDNPSKSGYTFVGWYKDEELTQEYDFESAVTSSFTLYAKWQKNQSSRGGGGSSTRCLVIYESNGGSKVDSVRVTRNKTLEKPENPTKDGYTFGGWHTDEELTVLYDFEAKVTKSFALYAKWLETGENTENDAENIPENNTENDSDNDVNDTSGHKCYSRKFNDLDVSQWYHFDTDYVLEKGIFNGVSETLFAPYSNTTRAMMITLLYRIEGEPGTNKSIPFADVDTGAYYANAVIWTQQTGISNGVSGDKFAPDDFITREQIATILFRYAQYKGMNTVTLEENLHFDDADEISEYAVSAMNWTVGTGLFKGRTENTLKPKDNATRAEVAALLHRFIEANK